MEAKEKELEEQKAKYAELYEESMGVVKKAMLKVRAELFREHQEGRSSPWDIAKAVADYEAVASDDESSEEMPKVPLLDLSPTKLASPNNDSLP